MAPLERKTLSSLMTGLRSGAEEQAVLGGVSVRMAAYFGVGPAWVRLIWILLALSDRLTPAAYLLLWILLPSQGQACSSWADSLRLRISDLSLCTHGLQARLTDTAAGSPGPSRESAARLVHLGGLLAVMGLLFLADNLHLLGPFQLSHLRPLALVLIGALALKRAAHGGTLVGEQLRQG